MIYLDHAATTPLSERVLEKMLPYLKDAGNPSSQHAAGRKSAAALLDAHDKIARISGCSPQEVYFTSGGTECGNWAVKGACLFRGRGRLVVSAIEHPAVLESALDMQKLGFAVTLVYPDERGVVRAEEVEKALGDDVIFCAVMHANNETGVIQPVEEIGKLCRERGVFYYCDCVQTAGVLPLPRNACDALAISAHKFYGPRGAGAMYIREGAHISRLMSGGKQERAQRGGTQNVAGAVGLSEALSIAACEREQTAKCVGALRDYFESRVLGEIEGAILNGGGERLPSHSNISFSGCDGENILFLLDLEGVCVSTGSACSAGAVTPSRVLKAMGLSDERAKSAVRFTFGKDNDREQIDRTVEILKRSVGKIRGLKK